jgi:type VI secretion system secreted protein Hcp
VAVFLSAVAILLSATQAFATAQECILSIPGVPGESTVVPNGIDVLTLAWGLHNAANAARATGSGRASRPEFSEFTITKKLDKSSPHLMLTCAEGAHYPHVILMCRKAGGERSHQDYLVYTLTDVLVSSYQEVGSSGNEIPTDQVSFSYGKIDFSYRPQNPDGSLGSPVDACWDLHAERACH